MLNNDRRITVQANAGMLEPFQSGLVRHLDLSGGSILSLVLVARRMGTTCVCHPRNS